MFQTGFPSIIRSSKLHKQRQVFVRPILLPAATLVRLAAGSSIGLALCVQFGAPDNGRKNCLKHVEHLTEINKLRNVASFWHYSANTYLLTPWCRVLLDQLTGLQLVKKFPRISRNPKVHYRTHNRPPPVSILVQPNPVHIPTSHLLEIHPNIIHPSTPRSPQWYLSLRFPHQDPIQYSENNVFILLVPFFLLYACNSFPIPKHIPIIRSNVTQNPLSIIALLGAILTRSPVIIQWLVCVLNLRFRVRKYRHLSLQNYV